MHPPLITRQACVARDMSKKTADVAELRKWREDSVDKRSEHHLPSGPSWSVRPGVRLHGVPKLDRVVDCIDVCYSIVRKQHPEDSREAIVKNLWCNPGQGVKRFPASRSLPTLATSTLLYSYEKDRLLSGAAHMQLLGWPLPLLPQGTFSEAEYRHLAGNGFSAPVAAMIGAILYSNPRAPWW